MTIDLKDVIIKPTHNHLLPVEPLTFLNELLKRFEIGNLLPVIQNTLQLTDADVRVYPESVIIYTFQFDNTDVYLRSETTGTYGGYLTVKGMNVSDGNSPHSDLSTNIINLLIRSVIDITHPTTSSKSEAMLIETTIEFLESTDCDKVFEKQSVFLNMRRVSDLILICTFKDLEEAIRYLTLKEEDAIHVGWTLCNKMSVNKFTTSINGQVSDDPRLNFDYLKLEKSYLDRRVRMFYSDSRQFQIWLTDVLLKHPHYCGDIYYNGDKGCVIQFPNIEMANEFLLHVSNLITSEEHGKSTITGINKG